MIAPAPSASSAATRSVPSGQRSPAGTTPIGPPADRAAVATAVALRRQPASTSTSWQAAAAHSEAPLGDGSASTVPAARPSSDDGRSDGPSPSRGPARSAPLRGRLRAA